MGPFVLPSATSLPRPGARGLGGVGATLPAPTGAESTEEVFSSQVELVFSAASPS